MAEMNGNRQTPKEEGGLERTRRGPSGEREDVPMWPGRAHTGPRPGALRWLDCRDGSRGWPRVPTTGCQRYCSGKGSDVEQRPAPARYPYPYPYPTREKAEHRI